MKGNVLKDAKRQRKKHRESGAWSQDSIEFNRDIQLPNNKKIVIEKLFNRIVKDESKREQKLLDLEVLISNLIIQKRKPIAISLSTNDWKISQYNRVSYHIIELVHLLHKHKLLNMKIGYKYKTEAQSRNTRIWATDRLFEYCIELQPHMILKPKECIILKDKDGKLKEYTNTPKTWHIRDILTKANKVNQAADIRYQKTRHEDFKLNVIIKAIFIESFTMYGRLHSYGYRHFQGFGEDERKQFTINGDPVVELDFQAMHPYLLYAKEGIQYSEDPYMAVYDDAMLRPILKKVLLIMINCKSYKKPYEYLYTQHKFLRELGIEKTRTIIEGFKEVHAPIAHYFCQGKTTGMKIMNKDSRIALDVVNHFAKQNIVILPVHDSFIVQFQHEDELRETMQQKYMKHTDGFRCKIN